MQGFRGWPHAGSQQELNCEIHYSAAPFFSLFKKCKLYSETAFRLYKSRL
ncbi:hypothetical protein C8J37_11655 [Rhizobium sp. PP-WC-1G-195]|nr:hypothetical protein C8J37_11655 [Rhizobium sp. PP-WC-1G-195]